MNVQTGQSRMPSSAVDVTQRSSSSVGPTQQSADTQQVDVPISDPEYVKIKADLDKTGRQLVRLVKLSNTILVDKFEMEKSQLTKVKKQPG